jgi:hypothetical protein
MKEMSNTDGKLLNLLHQHQEKNGEAHMILDFGNKKSSR